MQYLILVRFIAQRQMNIVQQKKKYNKEKEIGESNVITEDKIKYNIGEYVWNYWQSNHDIESIKNAGKTLRSEIEIGLRRRFKDFCEYQLLCNKLGIENKLNIG